MDIAEKLIRAALEGSKQEETVNEAMQMYSNQISNAINPLSAITAPIILSILHLYINSISDMFPGAKEQAEYLSKIPSKVVRIAVPRK